MTRRSPSSPSGDSPGSFLRVTSRFGLVVGLLFCGAASAQSVDLDPAASFEPPGAPPLVGWRVGLDGDWVVLPAIAQRWAHQGFVHVYRRGTSGYELDATIEPSVCFPGPTNPYVPGASGLTNCRFGIHVDVSEGRIAVGSNGGHRISAPILFDEAMDRAYATLEHPDPTSPLSTAFQFVYSVREVVPRVGASIARVVD